jgi:hypothetical protein
LQHIVLSHHGTTDFGSPKTPATPEAIAVHMIENLDAKMMVSLAATREAPAPGCEGNWSEYIKSLSGRFYRPDVAPPDEATSDEPESVVRPVSAPVGAPGNGSAPVTKPTPPAGPMTISNPLFETIPPRKK